MKRTIMKLMNYLYMRFNSLVFVLLSDRIKLIFFKNLPKERND